jgi:HD domain-containing protein
VRDHSTDLLHASLPRPDLRKLLALVLATAANAALIPAFLFVAPASHWSPPVLVVSIAALGLVGCFNSVKLANSERTFLDAEFVSALIAVVLLGPLPAFCVWLAGEIAYLVLVPQRLQAHLANIASFGWAALSGSLVLDALMPGGVSTATNPDAWIAVVASGVVMLSVNFAITTTLVGFVMDGRPVVSTVRSMLVATAPATVLMIATGALGVFGYLLIGIPALALFSATVFLPRSAGDLCPDPKASFSELEHAEAFPLYADRIASAMRLGSDERRVVRDAATFIRMDDAEPPRGQLSDTSDQHRHALVEALIYKGEHWDGCGGQPGAVGGEMIPLSSRILAVADAWANLTSGGFPQLTHAQALDLLQARAGLHFDPVVVAVAARVVEGQRV